eukprot:scaffold23505_cov119-Cylindrotheca_fusiformis.AAC.11
MPKEGKDDVFYNLVIVLLERFTMDSQEGWRELIESEVDNKIVIDFPPPSRETLLDFPRGAVSWLVHQQPSPPEIECLVQSPMPIQDWEDFFAILLLLLLLYWSSCLDDDDDAMTRKRIYYYYHRHH